MNTTVTQKGQATIPKQVREFLGLESGDKVVFSITDHGVQVQKQAVSEEEQYLKGVQDQLSDWDNSFDDIYNDV